jgi:hypothetical protein
VGLQAPGHARELERRIDALQERLDAVNQHVGAITRTPSWRLTAPLRGAKRLLARGRR